MINTEKKWLRYRFEKGKYDAELLLAFIEELPTSGLSETDEFIDAYFFGDNEVETDIEIQNIVKTFPEEGVHFKKDTILNENWHLNWQKHFVPISISSNIAVHPHWVEYRGPERIKIAIKPGMAFGTGTHPTTQMAIRLIEKNIKPGMTVMDAGCGSGILTIAALKLGAVFVSAWDIDDNIRNNFHEHMELNNIHDRFRLTIGDITKHNEYTVDFVLSNIETKPNLALLENMHKHGKIPATVFTGILKDEYAIFKAKVLNYELIVKDEMFQKEWVALVGISNEN